MNLKATYGNSITSKILNLSERLFLGKKKGLIVLGSAEAVIEHKRVEVSTDKNRLERLTCPENKKTDGYYSEDEGFISFESFEELKEIQKALVKHGISCTLQEAENFWCSFCQGVHYANWIKFADFENSLDDDSKKYALYYFYK